jgi:hypothetical protein
MTGGALEDWEFLSENWPVDDDLDVPEIRQREVLIHRVYRTGVQTVEREGDRYLLTLRNRSCHAEVEVPIETARRYYAAMKRK